MSSLPTKNLIFLQDLQNFKSIRVHPFQSCRSQARRRPQVRTLWGLNGKQIPAWGLRRRTVCFSGHNFEFDFLLAAVATPILGMDFLARFELSIIPAKQQVLHAASGCTFTKASTTSFISPWSLETAAAVAALTPQVQQLLEEFLSPLRPNPTPPKPLHGVVHHISTGSAAPLFARPRRLDPEKHCIAEEEFLALEKAGIIRRSN
jgi:hypothetical protein